MKKDIPFKVSARTARLIGRENIATSRGAIIELVKNGYDADSKFSIVYFDNFFSSIPERITQREFIELQKNGIRVELLDTAYIYSNEEYLLKDRDSITETVYRSLVEYFSKLCSIYIIDTGDGMTAKTIIENWMTIGTDNKAHNFQTRSGRVKTGAKGIGRFALDKLGKKCEMITFYDQEYYPLETDDDSNVTYYGYRWKVNWDDFEGNYKTIDNVNASLDGLEAPNFSAYIQQIIPKAWREQMLPLEKFSHGTILKISALRDNWDDFYVNQVYSDLEMLVPPKEGEEFKIFLLSSLEPSKYGEISNSLCDDYDYKVIASADNNQNVVIEIIRQEYDLSLIPTSFFQRENMQLFPYRQQDFYNGWKTKKTFSQLLPGYDSPDKDKVFAEIGCFSFVFYYLKRTYASDDAEKYFYKQFKANERKDWLEKFGGIKLFRDNFRVRPYGERQDAAFDWLGLGARKAKSPAAASKSDGGYRVEPENVAGTIKISRLTNESFEDKSSREGLQENKAFQIFKVLIAGIINIFENDRAFIAKEMFAFYNEQNRDEIDRKEAEEITKRIIAKNKAKQSAQGSNDELKQQSTPQDRELLLIAHLNEQKDEEIEKLKEEQKLLRVLASSGLVLASFSHDLGKLNAVLESRCDKLKTLITALTSESCFQGLKDWQNPLYFLERMKQDDIKMKNWFNFSLGAIRKDKRKRKLLYFRPYFKRLADDWRVIFSNRGIKFDYSEVDDIEMRVFEIDFDSIFSNLFVNSVDAFVVAKDNRERQIKISAHIVGKNITIDYYDSGPGLSKDIANPNDIFKPMFTTKRNAFTGEDEGTGLGMWIVKSIIEENDGKTKLLYADYGFGIRFSFPVKYQS